MSRINDVLRNGIREGSDRQTLEQFVLDQEDSGSGCGIDLDDVLQRALECESTDVPVNDLDKEAVRIFTRLVNDLHARIRANGGPNMWQYG